ncbi:MAG TPA: zinc-binding dehydrogenase [Myxococcales bacterium]|nr:zinc-binding dehydrogenase [Myxococcales bacterium]
MRQVWITRKGGPEVLEVREAPDPQPKPGEVRIRVRAAGVNFADLMMRRGLYPGAPRMPFVPGYEVAGEVDAGDPARIGRRVLAFTQFGGYSEFVIAPSGQAMDIPAGLSFAQAASIPVVWLTAWHMLVEQCNVRRGQRVLVHAAAGGVGTAALQICRRIGAEVIGTASASKHARLREMGLSHAIDYRTQDFEAEVKRITAGRGVHVILDAVGGASIKKGWRCLAPTGKLVVFGASSVMQGPVGMISSLLHMTPFWPVKVMQENKGLIGVHLGRLGGEVELLVPELNAILQGFAEGSFKPIVDLEVPLAEARRAHERLEQRQNFGKVVLVA